MWQKKFKKGQKKLEKKKKNHYFRFQFWSGNYKASKYISVNALRNKSALNGKSGNRGIRGKWEW